MAIYYISRYTMREMLSKKVILTFLVISGIAVIISGLIAAGIDLASMKEQHEAQAALNPMIPPFDARTLVLQIQANIATTVAALGVFLGVFATASLMPSFMEKGTIDVFLSKPVARYQALLGRFIGSFLMVAANLAVMILGVWLTFSAIIGIWEPRFLLSFLPIILTFAVLLSLTLLVSTLSNSSGVAIMISYIVFLVISPLLAIRAEILPFLGDSEALKWVMEVLYHVIPKTQELLNAHIVNVFDEGAAGNPSEVIMSTLALIFAYLGGAIAYFEKKDF